MRTLDLMTTRRRIAVAHTAATVVAQARVVELSNLPVLARVAILAEAAGALAALARRHTEASHLDVRRVAALVTDPADAYAVLGRGRWLPTMHRRVLTLPVRPAERRTARRVSVPRGQLSLFASTETRG